MTEKTCMCQPPLRVYDRKGAPHCAACGAALPPHDGRMSPRQLGELLAARRAQTPEERLRLALERLAADLDDLDLSLITLVVAGDRIEFFPQHTGASSALTRASAEQVRRLVVMPRPSTPPSPGAAVKGSGRRKRPFRR